MARTRSRRGVTMRTIEVHGGRCRPEAFELALGRIECPLLPVPGDTREERHEPRRAATLSGSWRPGGAASTTSTGHALAGAEWASSPRASWHWAGSSSARARLQSLGRSSDVRSAQRRKASWARAERRGGRSKPAARTRRRACLKRPSGPDRRGCSGHTSADCSGPEEESVGPSMREPPPAHSARSPSPRSSVRRGLAPPQPLS